MKKIYSFYLLLIFLILFINNNINAQWVNSIGGSSTDQIYNHALCTDANGNTYYTGFFTGSITIGGTTYNAVGGSADQDIYIVKYDRNGNKIWATSIGGTGNDLGRGIGVDNSGNIYATGYFYSPSMTLNGTTITNAGVRDIFVIKYINMGSYYSLGYIKGFGSTGDDAGVSIAVSGSGNCYIAGDFSATVAFGSTNLTSHGAFDIYVAKLNNAGTVQWAKNGGGSSTDNLSEVNIDQSENVYLSGYIQSTATFGSFSATSAGGVDIAVVKYDSSGNEIWFKATGGVYNDSGMGIAVGSNGNVNVTGYFNGTATFGEAGSATSAGGIDIFILQYNSSGTALWLHTAGGTSNDCGYDLALDATDNIYVSGYYQGTVTFGSLSSITSAGGQDAFVVKYNSTGTALYRYSAGGTGNDIGYGIVIDPSYSIFISGVYSGTATFGSFSRTSAGGQDVFVASIKRNYTWNGSSSTAWNVSTNWTPNGVPGELDNVTIVNATNQPYLNVSAKVNKITMTSGTLSSSYAILTIGDSSEFNGGTISCAIVSNGTSATYIGTTFSGTCTASCANVYLNGSTFNGTTSIAKTGSAGNSSIIAGNTFNGTTTITNSGSGTFILNDSPYGIDSYNGAVTFANTGAGFFYVGYGGQNNFGSNITCNGNIIFGGNGGTMNLNGAYDQTIGGGTPSITIHALDLSGKESSDLNVDVPINIINSILFGRNTKINNSIYELSFANGSYTLGQGSQSYIKGVVTKTGDEAFTFPIGDGNSYLPLSITAPLNSSDAFQARAFASTPSNSTSFDATIKSLIPAYWNLNRLSGNSSVQVTLYWDQNTPKPIFPDAAHIAWLNGTQWQDKGANNLNYRYLNGNVTSNTVSYFGYFTLGFTNANPAVCPTCDANMNWVSLREYDEYGRVINEQKEFSDNLGRSKQTQTRNLVANQILAQMKVYDTYGRLGLSTLAAPISSTTDFTYVSNFIADPFSNLPYTYNDFDKPISSDQLGEINNPSWVGTQSNTVGWYYSSNNTSEPYVGTTGYPYSRSYYNDMVIEGVKRSATPGDQLKMGAGHETRSITLPVYGELDHYNTLKNNYFFSSAGSSLNGEVLKKVTKDQNGTESITYTDKSGNTLVSCLASTTNAKQITASIQAKYSSYTLSVPANTRFDAIIIQSLGNVQIYNFSTNTIWHGAAISNPYTSLNAGDYITISSNTAFYVSYNIYTTVSGTEVFSKNKVKSSDVNYLNNSIDLHLQQGHGLSLSEAHSGAGTNAVSNVNVINLETGTSVYSGTVVSFTGSSSLTPGFYRIIYTSQQDYVNSNTLAYVSISYYINYGNYYYTYFDNAGRPIGQTAPNGVITTNTNNPNFTTKYTYNTLGWLLSSNDPDRGITNYIYRKDGKLRFIQNALQSSDGGKFSYTNYDNTIRVVETGEYTPHVAGDIYFQTMQDYEINGATAYHNSHEVSACEIADNTGGFDQIGNSANYNCATVSKVLYDVYDPLPVSYIQRNVAGKISKTFNDNILRWYSYDERGRLEWTIMQFAGTTSGTAGGDFSTVAANRVKTIDYVYDFMNNPVQTIFQKNVSAERLDHYYTYDIMQRLYKVETSLSGGPLVEHAQYSYYLHGPLKRKELGDNLQGIDYTYTVDGMLKAINHPYLDGNDPGADGFTGTHSNFFQDQFGMMLEYYDNDYVRDTKFQTTANLTSSGFTNYFNGNIRSWTWNQAACSTGLAQYAYKYDAKYQLTEADFGDHNTSTNQFTAAVDYRYRISGIGYDLNGNLQSLRRNDQTGGTASKDYINYFYNTNQNSLLKTQNNIPSDTRNYTYDAIGRMTSYTNTIGDNNKYLDYNYTGKVTGVYLNSDFSTPVVTFLYDEKGHRIRKSQYPGTYMGSPVSHTYYINDAFGNVLSVYNVNVSASTVAQNEIYIYGDERIGMVNKYGTPEYDYNITDHLGNVRTVFRLNSSTNQLEVLDYSDYYPHGGKLPGRGLISSLNPRYNCYQGEFAERDDETGYNNFDLRMYDRDVARWFTPDPYDEEFSPFLAMGNNGIVGVDPSGGKLKWWQAGIVVVAAVVVGVVTDGIGDAELVPALVDAFEMSEATAEVTSSVIMGATAGAISGGYASYVSGNNIGSHQFWSDMGVGAAAGAIGGFVGGLFDTWKPLSVFSSDAIKDAETLGAAIGKGAVKGAVTGAFAGFTFGFGTGLAEGGHSLSGDLDMGLTGAFTGAIFGGIAGAGEGYADNKNGLNAKYIKEKVKRKGVWGTLREAKLHNSGANGAFPKVTLLKIVNAYFFDANLGGTVGGELIENISDALFGEKSDGYLNEKWWGIKKENK